MVCATIATTSKHFVPILPKSVQTTIISTSIPVVQIHREVVPLARNVPRGRVVLTAPGRSVQEVVLRVRPGFTNPIFITMNATFHVSNAEMIVLVAGKMMLAVFIGNMIPGRHTRLHNGTEVAVAGPVKERVKPVIHHAVKISTDKDATTSHQVHASTARPAQMVSYGQIANSSVKVFAVPTVHRPESTSRVA